MSIDIESIHEDMLMGIPDNYQKTQGFPAYDFTRAFALACAALSDDISLAETHLDIYNLSGGDLDKYIYQHRGLTRKSGGKATAVLEILSGSGTIAEGDLFTTESNIVFSSLETKAVSDGDTVLVEAVESGTNGNVAANTIVQMPTTIVGISSFTNPDPATGGTDDETDDAYRERYFDNLRYPANGSNAQSYINWATSIDGVGRAKCFPLAFGANTVEVCITGADMGVPSQAVIDAVQEYIDPEPHGTGAGEAPIGSFCTVTPAVAKTINISAVLSIADGFDVETVKENIADAIAEYFASIAFLRLAGGKYQNYASYAKVGECIMETEGVLDYSNLTLNGNVSSVTLDDRDVPVVGMVTLT